MWKSSFAKKNKNIKSNQNLKENHVKGWERTKEELKELSPSELQYYNFLESFTLKMKQKRGYLGYSKRKVSELTGIEQAYIGKIENKKASPTLETIFRICNALKLDIEIKINIEN